MTWVNIPIEFFISSDFRGSAPTDRATWLALLAYCHAEENGGVIEGAASWGDRKWQQVVAVTLEETRSECDLWEWKDGNLIVHHYPQCKQEAVEAKRVAGKKGALNRWQKQKPSKPDGKPDGNAMQSANAERNRNGTGTKQNETPSTPEEKDEPLRKDYMNDATRIVAIYTRASGKETSFLALGACCSILSRNLETVESLTAKVQACAAVIERLPGKEKRMMKSAEVFFEGGYYLSDPSTFATGRTPNGDTAASNDNHKIPVFIP